MNKLNDLFIFTVGAVIGSTVTWKLLKNKYEQIAQEEIESVKEVFSKKYSETVSDTTETPETHDMQNYNDILENAGYKNEGKGDEKQVNFHNNEPYVISPEEFNELEDFDVVSLTYYADDILTDDRNEIIEDINGTIGVDSLNHFGEYEDDSVFVRNELLKVDYEILRDLRNYSDISTYKDDSPH